MRLNIKGHILKIKSMDNFVSCGVWGTAPTVDAHGILIIISSCLTGLTLNVRTNDSNELVGFSGQPHPFQVSKMKIET